MISDVSDLFSPPARFIVRWVAVPAIPSRSAAFLDSRLVFDPESIIASISTSVPPESITLAFWTGHKPVMSFKSFLWSAAQLVLPSAGTSCIRKGTGFGLRFELMVSLCRERWWFFLHLSQVVPSGFLQSFVWWGLRHLRHLLLCFTTSHLWFTVELWYSGQAAKWCFHAQPSGHASWSGVLSLLAAWFSVLLKVGPRWVRSFWSAFSLSGLPLERRVASWCNQVTRFDTFSSFPALCISLPKFVLSLGSSFDKSWDMKNGASDASNTVQPLSSISLTNTEIVVA